VRGKTFVGIGRDETTAVFCVSEEQSDAAAKANPAACESVRRMDARRSFLGLQVDLNGIPAEQLKALVLDAWRQQAPKKLADEFGSGQ
jgi:hypothetical protein